MGLITRSGPLTPSQQERWLALYWREYEGGSRIRERLWPLEPPVPVGVARRAMSRLVERHEILRTTFTIGPDGLPRQLVHAAETFALPVGTGGDGVSAALLGGATGPAPPWYGELLAEQGAVRAVRLHYKHLVTDGGGMREWQRQFLALCRNEDDGNRIGPVLQPLDRVEAAGGTPQSPHADGYDPTLGMPQSLVPPQDGAALELTTTLVVHGAVALLDDICRRALVSRSTIVQFALGLLLCRRSGRDRLLFANVLSPRRAVDPTIDCQMAVVPTPFVLDPGASFADALQRVQEATLRAYLHDAAGTGGPAARDARALTLVRRGIGGIAPVPYNFLAESVPRLATPRPADGGTPSGVSTGTRPSTLLGDPHSPAVAVHLVGADLKLDISADARILPGPLARAFGLLLQRLLEEMTRDLSAPVRDADRLLPGGFAAGTGSLDARSNWQDPRLVSALLAEAPGVLAASVTLEDGETTARLTLAPGTTFFDVHEHLLTRLAPLRHVTAPQRYLAAVAPASTPPDGWRPERDRPRLPPGNPAERALCAALERTHGCPARDLALTYAEAGGQLLRSPAVVEELRRNGLIGLGRAHFTSPCTLRAVARALTPVPPQER